MLHTHCNEFMKMENKNKNLLEVIYNFADKMKLIYIYTRLKNYNLTPFIRKLFTHV